MKYPMMRPILISLLFIAFTSSAVAQGHSATGEGMTATLAADLEWTDYQPEGFGPGLKIAVVSGDPSVADEPYVIRASFVDGFEIPVHFHPRAENLTMLSGTLLMAPGEQRDDSKYETYTAGDFLYIPGNHPHFGKVRGETVFQLHGIGPFQTILVDQTASR